MFWSKKLLIVLIIILIVVWFKYKKQERIDNPPSITQPSVLVNPNSATTVARAAEDIAKNDAGLSIRDLQLEDLMLYDQDVDTTEKMTIKLF